MSTTITILGDGAWGTAVALLLARSSEHRVTLWSARAESGRKALIVFSDGEDNSSAHHMLDAIESAQRENVVIFPIRYTDIRKDGRLTGRNKYGIRVMARLAKETGGADFDAEKADLKQAFGEIGEELRSSYELAYHSTHVADDGTFHKLVIRPKRPGLTVRAKTGYFAGAGAVDGAGWTRPDCTGCGRRSASCSWTGRACSPTGWTGCGKWRRPMRTWRRSLPSWRHPASAG